jgi:hypothetical protein
MQKRIEELEARIARIEALCEQQAKNAETQFKRIAQLQAEVDEMRAASANVKEAFSRK